MGGLPGNQHTWDIVAPGLPMRMFSSMEVLQAGRHTKTGEQF
jgi:hypothetical protein